MSILKGLRVVKGHWLKGTLAGGGAPASPRQVPLSDAHHELVHSCSELVPRALLCGRTNGKGGGGASGSDSNQASRRGAWGSWEAVVFLQ